MSHTGSASVFGENKGVYLTISHLLISVLHHTQCRGLVPKFFKSGLDVCRDVGVTAHAHVLLGKRVKHAGHAIGRMRTSRTRIPSRMDGDCHAVITLGDVLHHLPGVGIALVHRVPDLIQPGGVPSNELLTALAHRRSAKS